MILKKELLLEKCKNKKLDRNAKELFDISEHIDAVYQYVNAKNKPFFTYVPHGKMFSKKGRIIERELRAKIGSEFINDVHAYANLNPSIEMANLFQEQLTLETIHIICILAKKNFFVKSLLVENNKLPHEKIKDGSFKKTKRFFRINKHRFNIDKDAILLPPEMLYSLEDSFFRFEDDYELANEFVNIGDANNPMHNHSVKYGMCTELFATYGSMKIFNHPYLQKDELIYIKNYKDIEFFKEVDSEINKEHGFVQSYSLKYCLNIPKSVNFGFIKEW
jgi:hypothetical protein